MRKSLVDYKNEFHKIVGVPLDHPEAGEKLADRLTELHTACDDWFSTGLMFRFQRGKGSDRVHGVGGKKEVRVSTSLNKVERNFNNRVTDLRRLMQAIRALKKQGHFTDVDLTPFFKYGKAN
ncbi:MAG: hypothetical protein V1834_03845 [Candidatus Micrarchaeota archaeon]